MQKRSYSYLLLSLALLLSSCNAIDSGSITEGCLVDEGIASWYGEDYNGSLTANGETYDMESLTAAHKTLPFDSMVRVKNLDNGKTVTVRINNRGPFVEGRVIDLSRKAFEEIDMLIAGLAPVEVYLLPGTGPKCF